VNRALESFVVTGGSGGNIFELLTLAHAPKAVLSVWGFLGTDQEGAMKYPTATSYPLVAQPPVSWELAKELQDRGKLSPVAWQEIPTEVNPWHLRFNSNFGAQAQGQQCLLLVEYLY